MANFVMPEGTDDQGTLNAFLGWLNENGGTVPWTNATTTPSDYAYQAAPEGLGWSSGTAPVSDEHAKAALAYLQANPDVAAGTDILMGDTADARWWADQGIAWSPETMAIDHWTRYGQNEGRSGPSLDSSLYQPAGMLTRGDNPWEAQMSDDEIMRAMAYQERQGGSLGDRYDPYGAFGSQVHWWDNDYTNNDLPQKTWWNPNSTALGPEQDPAWKSMPAGGPFPYFGGQPLSSTQGVNAAITQGIQGFADSQAPQQPQPLGDVGHPASDPPRQPQPLGDGVFPIGRPDARSLDYYQALSDELQKTGSVRGLEPLVPFTVLEGPAFDRWPPDATDPEFGSPLAQSLGLDGQVPEMATAVTPPAPTTGGAMTGAVRPYEGDMLSYGQGPEHRWFEPAVMGTPATGGGVPTGPTAPGAWQSPEGTNVFQDYASAATGGGTGSTPGQISNVIAPVMQQMAANYGGGGIPSVGGVDGLLPTAGMDGLASSLGLIDYGSSWYGSDPATQIFNRPVEGAVPYGEYGESLLGAVQLLDPTPISSLIGIGMDLNNVSAVRDAYQKLIDMGIYSGELPTGMEAAGQYLGALLPFGLGNGYGSGNTKAVLDMGYYNDDRINSQAFLEATLNAGMIPLPSAMSDPVKGVDPNTGEMAFTPDEINAYQDAYFPGGDFAWTDPGSVENRTLGSVENPTEAAELTTNTGGPSYFQHASTLIPTVEPTIAPTLPTPIAPTLPPVEIDTPLSSYVPPAPILTPPPPPGGGRGAVSRALPAPAPTPTYSFPSSKRFKNTYAQAQPGEMLRSLRGMPLHLWRYKEVTPAANDAPHVGPYAEDWLEHTGLGDGQSINAVDAIGMLLGAVQALDAEVRELRAERQAQEKVRFLKHPSRGVLLSRQGN